MLFTSKINGLRRFPEIRKSNKIYCFDALGIEYNIIAEVILWQYDLRISKGIVTHATTNLNAEELEKLYGNSVRSRLRSMFNLVAFSKDVGDKRK